MKNITDRSDACAPEMRMGWLIFLPPAGIVLGLSWVARHYQLDDALIYARYIQNALNNAGLAFNPGEHVNALTSPLFAYLLLGLSFLSKDVLRSEVILFAVFFISAIWVMMIDLRQIAGWKPALTAGLFVASVPYFYTTIGMETSLFLLMLSSCFWAFRSGRNHVGAVFLALTLLTRPEGGLLLPTFAWEHIKLRRSRPTFSVLIGPVILVCAYIILNFALYRGLLPQSSSSKIGQGLSGLWGHWPTAFFHARWILEYWGDSLYLPILGVALGWGAWRSLNDEIWGRCIPIFLVGLLAFYLFFNIPGYHWYYAPFFFFLMPYAALGLWRLSTTPVRRFAVTAAVTAIILQCVYNTYTRPFWTPSPAYLAIGSWLAEHTPPGASVAACEIGTVGWYSHRPIIDIIGLTDPQLATLVAHRDVTTWLKLRSPDYIVIHQPGWVWEQVAIESPNYLDTGASFGAYRILKKRDRQNLLP